MSTGFHIKFLVHSVFLRGAAFTDENPEIQKPAFIIKFYNYKPIKIEGKYPLKPIHFSLLEHEIEEKNKMLLELLKTNRGKDEKI